jgi:uncharacterized membrane protein YsdA (DUF1294 family)
MEYEAVIALIVLAFWNLIAFSLMGIDKRRAIKQKRRISEKSLFLCAFLFGGIGVLGGMYAFRHKTKHWSFKLLVPAAVILNIAVILSIHYFLFKK